MKLLKIIESNKGEYQIYLKEYELAKKMNIRKDIITYFYDPFLGS